MILPTRLSATCLVRMPSPEHQPHRPDKTDPQAQPARDAHLAVRQHRARVPSHMFQPVDDVEDKGKPKEALDRQSRTDRQPAEPFHHICRVQLPPHDRGD